MEALRRHGQLVVSLVAQAITALWCSETWSSAAGLGSSRPFCHGMMDAYGGGEAFQVLALRRTAIPKDGGLVRFDPKFNLVS